MLLSASECRGRQVAAFLRERDGSDCSADDVFLTDGASAGVRMLMQVKALRMASDGFGLLRIASDCFKLLLIADAHEVRRAACPIALLI